MSETAKHETLGADPSTRVADGLEKLDLTTMSFIQLRRLQNVLRKVAVDVEKESARRADADASGDTVRVSSPKL
jgi:hypothetical protein